MGGEAAGKDASNYWSTFARTQAGVAARAPLALCGSSITGRLPGAGQGDGEVANFGSDGGSGADGVAMIADGLASAPRYLVFETNTLRRYLIDGTKRELDPGSPWFKAGVAFGGVSAQMRPSKLLYAKALGRPSLLADQVQPFEVASQPLVMGSAEEPEALWSPLESQRIDALLNQLARLQEAGCRILLVQYPSKPVEPEFAGKHQVLVRRLSSQLGCPYWDLQQGVSPAEVSMTDAVHMGPESAARALRTLELYFDE